MKSREEIETDRVARVFDQGLESKPLPDSTKSLTWQHIKDLSNLLTPDQLRQPVKYWTESDGGTIGDANILDEDYVSDGEAYAPESEMAPECIDEDEPIFPEGTVMLWII